VADDPPGVLVKSLVTLILALAATAHADVRVSAGGAISDRGESVAGDVEVHASWSSASIRYADRLTALVGFAPRPVKRASEPAWKAGCIEAMRTAADRACWIDGVAREAPAREELDGWFGAAAGMRRDRDHTLAVAAAQLYPSRRAELELAVTAVVAGPMETYVHHARFAPGWYARGRIEHAHVFAGGEAGMTGFASRNASGALRAETYALATLGVTWER